MPDDWQPTGAWMRGFRQSLIEAFDEPSIQLLTVDHFTGMVLGSAEPGSDVLNNFVDYFREGVDNTLQAPIRLEEF